MYGAVTPSCTSGQLTLSTIQCSPESEATCVSFDGSKPLCGAAAPAFHLSLAAAASCLRFSIALHDVSSTSTNLATPPYRRYSCRTTSSCSSCGHNHDSNCSRGDHHLADSAIRTTTHERCKVTHNTHDYASFSRLKCHVKSYC